jgi:hypothetical protein
MDEDKLSELGSRPPPRKEDILFPRRSHKEQQGDLTHTLGDDWVYSNGFRLAARHLAERLGDAGNEQIFLIYPIVYLYRHHAELVLKAIIKSATTLLDREITGNDSKILGSHDLRELWTMAQILLNPVCEIEGTSLFLAAELEWVDSYIGQIHEHDPDGQRFRYATMKAKGANKSGATTPSLSRALELANVATAMENLADFLEGIDGWLDQVDEAKAEFKRRQMASEGNT